jgi:uncharacterized protein YdeI (YjbR/CyaY-like superfamily)
LVGREKARIDRLTAAGLMSPAGMSVVAAAQADGSWSALDEVETLAEPDDLSRALDAVPPARGRWDAFPPSARLAILQWLASAKTQGTRSSRVQRVVTDAEQGIRSSQWRQPGQRRHLGQPRQPRPPRGDRR